MNIKPLGERIVLKVWRARKPRGHKFPDTAKEKPQWVRYSPLVPVILDN